MWPKLIILILISVSLLATGVNAQSSGQLVARTSLVNGKPESKSCKPDYGKEIDFILANMTEEVKREFEKAWDICIGGASSVEGLVLLYRMPDGSLLAIAQGRTNESRRVSFKWTSSVIAIVHTHPNLNSPRPSEEDVEVSKRLRVPVFTITSRGMFVYDPVAKKISRVMKYLTWLPSRRSADLRIAVNR